jgi:hypothetical protein
VVLDPDDNRVEITAERGGTEPVIESDRPPPRGVLRGSRVTDEAIVAAEVEQPADGCPGYPSVADGG